MPKDILLNDDFDLRTTNGDLVIGESTNQHKSLLILSRKGSWKESPLTGVGAVTYLQDDDLEGLQAETRKEFLKDGLAVEKLRVYPDGSIEEISAYPK
jgi:hypothetical protein